MKRILLSTPHMGGSEERYVREAFRSNWLSTVGPNVRAFEEAFEARVGLPAAAVASGTAAIHLGLRLLGVGPGDEVLCPTLTFVATANPVRYLGAAPVFIDSDYRTWNVDPGLLERALEERRPKAAIVVHLYGQCADMGPILEACGRHGVPVLEDAAEALGATYRLPHRGGGYTEKHAGTMGEVGAFSFNGNKIITTAGGGMLVAQKREWVEKARFWATQAREAAVWYEHSEMGYNYRLSNVLAGIGLGQLEVLDLRVAERRAVERRYREAFAELEGIEPMPEAGYGVHTHWLSCFLIDEERFGRTRDELMAELEAAGVESRPVWKPMHLQPLYAGCRRYGGEVAEDLFRRGICLPSSSSLTEEEQEYVIGVVKRAARRGQQRALSSQLSAVSGRQ